MMQRVKISTRITGLIAAACLVATVASAQTPKVFDLKTFEQMRVSESATLELILNTLHDAVLYTEKSIDRPAICVSLRPLPITDLLALIDQEIAVPTHPDIQNYGPTDRIALIYLNAIKSLQSCQ